MMLVSQEGAMHLVRYQVAISLDGFIAPKDGSADWLNPYGKVAGEVVGPWMKQIGGIVMGRATYDQGQAMGGGMWGGTPTLVMTSRALPRKKAEELEAADNMDDGLKRLKARVAKGDIWLFGGGRTAGRFLAAGLVDMIELTTVPVVLGAGRTLFDGVSVEETFELAAVEQRALGCVSTTYRKGATPAKRRTSRNSPRDSRSAGSR
jgi:dihydrofolate reductase